LEPWDVHLRSLLILSLVGLAGGAAGGAVVPGEDPPSPAATPVEIWGGDVRSLAIHPEDPDLLAAGTSAGHVYLSRDGGRSWQNAGVPVPFPDWVVGTLRFDPHRPRRLWAALWGVWGSGLVAMSDDLGATWRERMGSGVSDGLAGALPREPVYDLVVENGKPDLLYAGARSGVWLTRNAGLTWNHLTAAYPEIHHVSSLLVHPETLIAGTWRRAYRSDDGGLTWRGAFSGMELDSEVFQLRSVPGHPEELWASTCGWVYRSSDLGASWTRFKEGLPERRTPSFAVLEDGRLLAGTIAGLYVSGDGGGSWRRRTDPALGIRAIAHDPRRPDRIVLGTEGAGVWISTDGGRRFEPSSRGMTNVRIEAVVALPGEASREEVLVAVRDAGPFSGIYRSTDAGRTFELEAATSGEALPPVLDLAVIGDRVYAATKAGWFARRGTDWHRAPEPEERRVDAVKRADPALAHVPADVSGPFDPQGLETVAGGRLLWGRHEVWFHGGDGESWRQVDTGRVGQVLRVLDTGDPRGPYLLVGDGDAELFDPAASGSPVGSRLPLFFPARDIVAAARVDGRLLLGTTGHGLVSVELSRLDARLRGRVGSSGDATGARAGRPSDRDSPRRPPPG
jgi:photosystem II stability/assembly factor-like uncharacterized protein